MLLMIRYLIIFEGIVQGVGFRYTAYSIANKYNLTGVVRNLDNGNVEIQIQGNEDNINAFLKDILKNDYRFIKIFDYSIKKIPLIEEEYDFRVEY